MHGPSWLAVTSLLTLAGCIHSVPFAPEVERNWKEVAPSGQPRAVKIVSPGETLVFYEAAASTPLEVHAAGPLKLHLQIRMRAREGVKGRVKLTAWTQVDDRPAVPRSLNVKISKKWRAGGRVTTRRIIRLRLEEGDHVVRFGLAGDSPETALVRVVSRSPAEEK